MRSDRLEQLYSEMGGMIYRRCLRMLGDKEEARVGVQEVFLRFMMSLSTADGTAVKRVNLDLLFFENRWQSGWADFARRNFGSVVGQSLLYCFAPGIYTLELLSTPS